MVRFFIDQTLYMDSLLFNFVTSWHVDEFPLNFDLLPYLLPMQDLEKTAEMEFCRESACVYCLPMHKKSFSRKTNSIFLK